MHAANCPCPQGMSSDLGQFTAINPWPLAITIRYTCTRVVGLGEILSSKDFRLYSILNCVPPPPYYFINCKRSVTRPWLLFIKLCKTSFCRKMTHLHGKKILMFGKLKVCRFLRVLLQQESIELRQRKKRPLLPRLHHLCK